MKDYRMGLLSEIIKNKLGLKQKLTLSETMINEIIFDVNKELNE